MNSVQQYFGYITVYQVFLSQYKATDMDSKKTGVLAILGASLMWAIEPVFAKLAYANSDFLQTSGIRAIVVAVTALLYVLLTGKGNLKVTRGDIPKLL